MEPFREVRTPERNYGTARLPGGAVSTPLARRLAGESGIDLTRVKGSGPHGRIVAKDIEQARGLAATALTLTPASAQIVLTAEIALADPLALCAEVDGVELADVVVKAWATALRRAMPDASPEIALATGNILALIPNVAERSLSAIATSRRDASGDAQRAASGIFIADVPGIASIAHTVRPPQTTMLSIGSRRRAPIEAPDGSIAFGATVTATLSCDPAIVNAALGAELLSTFKGFLERPVTMLV
jgi:pyruvate dehydrogenase E2 component (dihydrolipoamide acetyltransferase)